MYNKRIIGSQQEEIAKLYIENKGYKVIEQNFACRTGEIDMIAYDRDYLVFVEVKYRKNIKTGYPIESIDHRKIKKITKTAMYYVYTRLKKDNIPMRFDAILILEDSIEHIENCFDAMW